MNRRARREARAERLAGWAATREQRANAQLTSQPELRHDWAFITQPGHIPERARMNRRDDAAFRSLDKADEMKRRADGIRAQNDRTIFSDDDDAIPRLRERIAELEVKVSTRKEANAVYRKAHRAELAAMTPYERSQAVPWPSYSITNMTGNIARLRKRLDAIENPRPTWFHPSRRDPEVCWKCDYAKADHTPHEKAPTVLMCPTKERRS